MEFKIPKLPSLSSKSGRQIKRTMSAYKEFRVTIPEELEIVKTIGRGSFGMVKLCKKNGTSFVILKEMIDSNGDHEKLFLKEAKMLNTITHENIVNFDSVLQSDTPDTFAFLMEYVYFDFSHFGQDEQVSSLKDFLKCMDSFNASGFEHCNNVIAADVTRGLAYLHNKGIVYRDLKPENVLVSNQHYKTAEQLSKLWQSRPVISKLTNFGESRATILQTASLVHTKTSNVSRGTPVFMAPEIVFHDGESEFDFEKLKKTDIWSLALTFYMLVNIDMKYPFEHEVKSVQKPGINSQNIMRQVLKKQPVPKHGEKYSVQRKVQWSKIATMFEKCSDADAALRPSAEEILQVLEENRDREMKNDLCERTSSTQESTQDIVDQRNTVIAPEQGQVPGRLMAESECPDSIIIKSTHLKTQAENQSSEGQVSGRLMAESECPESMRIKSTNAKTQANTGSSRGQVPGRLMAESECPDSIIIKSTHLKTQAENQSSEGQVSGRLMAESECPESIYIKSTSVATQADKQSSKGQVSGRLMAESECLESIRVVRSSIETQADDQSSQVCNKPSFSTGDVRFICENKTSYGERMFQYRVNDTIDVLIYTGSLTRLDKVDAILCTIGPDLRGGHLAQSVMTAGGKTYEKELNEKGKIMTGGTTFLCKKTGGMKLKGILHIVLEQPIRDTSKGQLQRLSLVFQNVVHGAERLKLRSLAMPLVGAGTIKSPAGIQQICSCLSSTIVSVPNTKTKLLHLKELHLVNRDQTITSALLDEFKQLSGYKLKGSYSGNGKHDQSRRPGARGGYTMYDKPSAYKPSSTERWERHQPLNDTASMKQVETKTEETKAKKSQAEVTKAPAGTQCIYCNKQAANSLSCGHTFCTACFIPMRANKECFKCNAGVSPDKGATSDSNQDDTCPVCMDTFKNPKTLNCGHKLCGICLEQVAKHKPQCPVCGDIFGAVKGTQPDGEMFYRSTKDRLPGYKDCGTIEIFYDFPGGKQGSEHPHPGKPYAGTQKRAFLPDNDEGRKVLKLLRRAFDRRLIFTLGESWTTGKEGKITWNDIHHKTKPDGGTSNFGYPDPTYLSRVQEQLTAKGVTE